MERLDIYGHLTRHFHISVVGVDEVDVISPLAVCAEQVIVFFFFSKGDFGAKFGEYVPWLQDLDKKERGAAFFRLNYEQEWRLES